MPGRSKIISQAASEALATALFTRRGSVRDGGGRTGERAASPFTTPPVRWAPHVMQRHVRLMSATVRAPVTQSLGTPGLPDAAPLPMTWRDQQGLRPQAAVQPPSAQAASFQPGPKAFFLDVAAEQVGFQPGQAQSLMVVLVFESSCRPARGFSSEGRREEQQ